LSLSLSLLRHRISQPRRHCRHRRWASSLLRSMEDAVSGSGRTSTYNTFSVRSGHLISHASVHHISLLE
uniref:Uncharacterized protein n=1 Tax=Triticum urartu TaxID=4572 RepID=A0A8R7PQU7_TRIUA